MCYECIFLLKKYVALITYIRRYKSDTYGAWAGSEAGECMQNIIVSSLLSDR